MALEIRNISGHRGIRYRPLRDICKKILSDMKLPDAEVSLLFVDDEYIKKINKKYLNRNRPTDVIAFSMLENVGNGFKPFLIDSGIVKNCSLQQKGVGTEQCSLPTELPIKVLGDIIISVDTAKRQAKEFGHSINQELKILFIHGLFHLFGYDDTSRKSKREMLKMEMRYR